MLSLLSMANIFSFIFPIWNKWSNESAWLRLTIIYPSVIANRLFCHCAWLAPCIMHSLLKTRYSIYTISSLGVLNKVHFHIYYILIRCNGMKSSLNAATMNWWIYPIVRIVYHFILSKTHNWRRYGGRSENPALFISFPTALRTSLAWRIHVHIEGCTLFVPNINFDTKNTQYQWNHLINSMQSLTASSVILLWNKHLHFSRTGWFILHNLWLEHRIHYSEIV